MDKLLSAIKCNICQKVMESPVLLPCSHSICKCHVDEAFGLLLGIDCSKCSIHHNIPDCGGFPANQALAAVIESQVANLNFGKVHEEAKQTCSNIEELINKVEGNLNQWYKFINGNVNNLKMKVDEASKNLAEKLSKIVDRIKADLDELKNDSLQTLEATIPMNEIKTNKSTLETKVSEWKLKLNNMNYDENVCKAIIEDGVTKFYEFEKYSKRLERALLKKDFENLEKIAFTIDNLSKINLEEAYHKNPLELNSTIITAEMESEFNKLCMFKKSEKWSLLYRASRDGFSAAQYHAKCDDITNTLTIIKTTEGYIFGAYEPASELLLNEHYHSSMLLCEDHLNGNGNGSINTTISNSSSGSSNSGTVDDEEFKRLVNLSLIVETPQQCTGFLFSFVHSDKENPDPTIYPMVIENPLTCDKNTGPTFIRTQKGNQEKLPRRITEFSIGNNSNSEWTSCSDFSLHALHSYSTDDAKRFLAGSYYFQVAEIEVYQRLNN